MFQLEAKETGIILVSSVISVVLARYLPEEPYPIFGDAFVDLIILAFGLGILILLTISIGLFILNTMGATILNQNRPPSQNKATP